MNLKMKHPRININAAWMYPRFTVSIDTIDGSPSVEVGSKIWNNLPDCEAKRFVELLSSTIEELNDKLKGVIQK